MGSPPSLSPSLLLVPKGARPLPRRLSPFLSSSSLSSLRDGFLRPCIEFDWERRPYPPCALRGFDLASNSWVVLLSGDDFRFGLTSFGARDFGGFPRSVMDPNRFY